MWTLFNPVHLIYNLLIRTFCTPISRRALRLSLTHSWFLFCLETFINCLKTFIKCLKTFIKSIKTYATSFLQPIFVLIFRLFNFVFTFIYCIFPKSIQSHMVLLGDTVPSLIENTQMQFDRHSAKRRPLLLSCPLRQFHSLPVEGSCPAHWPVQSSQSSTPFKIVQIWSVGPTMVMQKILLLMLRYFLTYGNIPSNPFFGV